MGDKDNYMNCWNPRIIVESDNQIPIEEGCLDISQESDVMFVKDLQTRLD